MFNVSLLAVATFFFLCTYIGPVQAEIYKWVDANGTIHFSDKPIAQDAQKVDIQGTGIVVEMTEAQVKTERKDHEALEKAEQQAIQTATKTETPSSAGKDEKREKSVSEADYRITSSVGKLGADGIRISGRISGGLVCRDMVVMATARNDNGLSATITDHVSKTKSFGSTVFDGSTRVSGSAEDRGFWKVDKVTIDCND